MRVRAFYRAGGTSATHFTSVRQPVDDVVDSELVRLVRLVERPEAAARPLPVLRDVGVVVDDRPSGASSDRCLRRDRGRPAGRRCRPAGNRRATRSRRSSGRSDARRLHRRRTARSGSTRLMFSSKFSHPPPPGPNSPATLKSSKMTKPPFCEIRAERRRLPVGHRPPAGFGDVGDRILRQLRVVQREHVEGVGVRAEIADLVHDPHQVVFGERIAVRPRRQPLIPVAARGRRVFQPRECEPAVIRHVAGPPDRGARQSSSAARERRCSRTAARRCSRAAGCRWQRPAGRTISGPRAPFY